MIGGVLVEKGLADSVESDFTRKAVSLVNNGIELVGAAAVDVAGGGVENKHCTDVESPPPPPPPPPPRVCMSI